MSPLVTFSRLTGVINIYDINWEPWDVRKTSWIVSLAHKVIKLFFRGLLVSANGRAGFSLAIFSDSRPMAPFTKIPECARFS